MTPTNRQKADQETLAVTQDHQWYFADIEVETENWIPKLVYHEIKFWEECFIYEIKWTRKFFIETRVNSNREYTTTSPRIEILSYNKNKIIDDYLKQYPHYLSVEEILVKFITNDLSTMTDHNRDKILHIRHCTDLWQRSIGYLDLSHDLLEKIVASGLSITYSVAIY